MKNRFPNIFFNNKLLIRHYKICFEKTLKSGETVERAKTETQNNHT